MTINQPIFVVGCGRSGTTLVFDLLSQHPDLARTTGYPDGEDHTGWIAHGRCAMAGIGNARTEGYGSGINGSNYCLHLTDADAAPDVVDAMRGYYWTDVLRQDARRRVINKNPHLSNKLAYVLGIFPDARIVHVVRDCEPVVGSWLAVMDQHPSLTAYLPDDPMPCIWLFPKPEVATAQSALHRHKRFFPGGGAGMWIDYWNAANKNIAPQMHARPDQLSVIRYEDLVAGPERVLTALTDFCRLRPHQFDTTGVVPGMSARHAALLTPSLREEIAHRADPVRRHFGYVAAGGRQAAPALAEQV